MDVPAEPVPNHRDSPTDVVARLYDALRDRDIAEIQAVTDPRVVCHPLVRPGLTMYFGHAGMIELAEDMHRVHGDYSVELLHIDEGHPGTVIVDAIIANPQTPHREPLRVLTTYEVSGGRITSIDSRAG